MANTVETYVFLTLNVDGTIGTYAEVPAELPERTRPVNNYDLYQTAKQMVDEFEQSLLAERIAQQVAALIAPKSPTVSDAVGAALKERGITPDAQ